jgi:predicted RNase H-like nuclease (RuvC/YqgF family)
MSKTNKAKHDYLMKVENNEDGWKTIKQMRENAKKCGSSYKLVLRGSKPKTPWGNRPSIPLDESQEIRIYIRPKANVSYENPRAYDGVYEGLVHRNRALMDANQQLEDKNYKLRTQLEVLISNETSDAENENHDLHQDVKAIRTAMTDTISYLKRRWG